MRVGSKGDAVRELQHKLNAAHLPGVPLLTADGVFGPKTLAAVQAARETLALLVDEQLVAALDERAKTMPTLTIEQWRSWTPNIGSVDQDAYYPHVVATVERFEISTDLRLAMFLAQTYHESSGYTRWEENLNYSAKRLMQVWPSRFPSLAKAQQYAHNPEKLANSVYANRLGNGGPVSGDGWRYRGRGPIQITGRANYTECSRGIGHDVVTEPALLAQAECGFLSAGWFWQSRGLNEIADSEDVRAATRRINGGYTGLSEREKLYRRARTVLEA
jgi:putative chitinase